MEHTDFAEAGRLPLLARTVAAGAGLTSGQQAMRELDPVIRRLATQVCSAYSPGARWVKDDFIEQSPSLVFEQLKKGGFDPVRGSFMAWCHEVLRTRFISELRRQKRHRAVSLDALPSPEEHDGRPSVPTTEPGPAEQVALTRYWQEPFTTVTLSAIQEWPPRHRIVGLALAVLWRRVPPDRWARWCIECEIDGDFPPADFLDQNPSQCQELVAEALRITLNHLYVIKHRVGPALLEVAPDSRAAQEIRRRLRQRGPNGGGT